MLFRAYSRPQTESTIRPFPKGGGAGRGGEDRQEIRQNGCGSLGCPRNAPTRSDGFSKLLCGRGTGLFFLPGTKRHGIPRLPLRFPPAGLGPWMSFYFFGSRSPGTPLPPGSSRRWLSRAGWTSFLRGS